MDINIDIDSFISDAKLVTFSYVTDVTKPGQRTGLTEIFDTILSRSSRAHNAYTVLTALEQYRHIIHSYGYIALEKLSKTF